MLVNKEPHTVSLVTEPLSSVSLATEEVADAEPFAKPFPVAKPFTVAGPFSTVELISRESRSAKNNNKKARMMVKTHLHLY